MLDLTENTLNYHHQVFLCHIFYFLWNTNSNEVMEASRLLVKVRKGLLGIPESTSSQESNVVAFIGAAETILKRPSTPGMDNKSSSQ